MAIVNGTVLNSVFMFHGKIKRPLNGIFINNLCLNINFTGFWILNMWYIMIIMFMMP